MLCHTPESEYAAMNQPQPAPATERLHHIRDYLSSAGTQVAALLHPIRNQAAAVLILASIFLAVWQAPPQHGFEGVASYAWLHTTLESFSILVAGMVFGLAWTTYRHDRPGNVVLLACGLLAVGFVDVLHMLSYAGMPDFITPAGPEKAINFWLASRLIFAAVLLWIALKPWAPLSWPSARYLLLGLTLLLLALVTWVGLFHQQALPRTFLAGQGLTDFKVGMELVIIGLFAVATVALLWSSRRAAPFDIPRLFAAAAISILTELCFVLYSDVTDFFNLLGHIYKVVSYAYIYQAVVIGSVRDPFDRVVRSEAEIRTASSYARSLIEASLDPFVTVDERGRITGVNQAAQDITGLGEKDLLGAEFANYFTEPDKARATCRTALAQGAVRNYPLTLRHKSGQHAYVLYSATAYHDDEGRRQGVFIAVRDITEAQRVERELARQHALLSNIAATSQVGLTVWGNDGRLKLANASAERLLRLFSGGVAPASHDWSGWRPVDHAGNPIPRNELPFRKALMTGQPVYDVPIAVEGSDGQRILLSMNASPLQGEGGQPEGVVITIEDITRRKAAEAMLKDSEELLAMAMSAAHMGVWSCDVAGGLFSYSDEVRTLFGLPAGVNQMSREGFLELICSSDRDRMRQVLQQALIEEKGEWSDFRVVWPDASLHWVSVRGAVLRDTAGKALKISGIALDITARKNSELDLNRANRALRTLSAGNEQLIHAKEESELLNAVCRVIVEVGGYCMAWVGKALDDENKTVQPVASCGDDENLFGSAPSASWADDELGRGPVGTAIRTGITQVTQNYATNPLAAPWRDEVLKRGYQSSIVFPLRELDRVYGSLTIYAGELDAFNADEVDLLQELANDLAFGIVTLRTGAERDRMAAEQKQHEAVLRQSLVESIQAIATTLELRDPYTAGHQRRVATLASAIGEEMGLSPHQIEGMHLAASIHDVGKVRVPSELLNRPGKLLPIEMELIRTHAQSGHDIVKDVRFPWPIARIIVEHHERVDGSGYPNGRRGDQLLLESKIVTVADVVEAMTSHRPYRPGLGLDAALAHIAEYRGVWYDEAVVDACMALFRENRFQFEALGRAA